MTSKTATIALLTTLAMAAIGCGSGLSKEDATQRCDQERAAKSACITDAAYNQCIACQEECGDSCLILESCPLQYNCPAE